MENILPRRRGWHESYGEAAWGAGGQGLGQSVPMVSGVSSAERAQLLHVHLCTHPAPVLQAARGHHCFKICFVKQKGAKCNDEG